MYPRRLVDGNIDVDIEGDGQAKLLRSMKTVTLTLTVYAES